MSLVDLSNEALATRLRQYLGEERGAQVAFLLHLEEFDRREEWRRLGYATLWQYCRRELGLLENAIFLRTSAIRLLRQFPGVVERLRDGRLSLTTLVELKEVLSPETTWEILERAAGKSKREVEALVASLKAPVPAPAARAAIRALPPAQPLPATREEAPELSFEVPAANVPRVLPAAPVAALHAGPPAAPPAVPPAAPTRPAPPFEPRPEAAPAPRPEPRFEIKLVVSRQFVEALEHAKRRLSHSVPNGDTVGVLQHCLERLLAMDARRHAALPVAEAPKRDRPTVAPSQDPPTPAPRASPQRKAVPAAVVRAVWQRDGGRCQWKLANGEICASRWKVQLDHTVPVALGGESTEAACRLLCRIHNVEAARQVFGAQVMDRYRGRPDIGRAK